MGIEEDSGGGFTFFHRYDRLQESNDILRNALKELTDVIIADFSIGDDNRITPEFEEAYKKGVDVLNNLGCFGER